MTRGAGDETAGRSGIAPTRVLVAVFDGLRAMVVALLFAFMGTVAHVAVAVYFGRLRVVHRERFPDRGPVLLVANHPAAWTDVVVLDVAFGRKLRFLAQQELFRSRPRAALLAIHGALPAASHPESSEARRRNRQTLERCHEAFARGEAVALFPEGMSLTDRTVLPLRTGAARIALSESSTGSATAGVTLIPAGIRYADRASFGSDVTVSVGEPVVLEPFRTRAREDPEAAVRELTERMHRDLSELVASTPDVDVVGPVRRRLAGRVALCAVGGLPAAVGALLHALPWAVGELVARRIAPEPERISFARIGAGLVLIPVYDALLFAGLVLGLHLSLTHAALVMVAVAALGAWTLTFGRWLRALAEAAHRRGAP